MTAGKSIQSQHHVIDLSEWIDLVEILMAQFLDHLSINDQLSNHWHRQMSTAYVHSTLDECMSVCMAWAKNTHIDNGIDTVCEAVLTIASSVSLDRRKLRDSMVELLDPVYLGLMNIAEQLTQEEPWWVWHLHFRYDHVIAESAGDYRINYFMEKCEVGEWAI